VVVHEPTKEYAPDPGNELYTDVRKARLKQTIETPLDERISYASWPETVAYLEPASKDRRYTTKDFEEAYRHSLRTYLDEWTPLDPDDQPEPLCDDPDLNDAQAGALGELRYGIKKDRDKYFIENVYDDLAIETVPEEFWLNHYEQQADQTQINEYSQAALAGFTDP
jgi:hypothetical protein